MEFDSRPVLDPRHRFLLLLSLVTAAPALAGGGVMLENDTCIITIGFYKAHFTAYQPETRGDEEFCEDLPDTGEGVFVLDYLHDSLKEVPVEFRIIRDVTGLGRFVRLEDVQALDLEAHTVYHRPAVVEPGGSYQVSHVFEEPGSYIGIVTAGHPTRDKTYTAVFPFEAGTGGFPYLWVLAGLAAAAAAYAGYLRLRPRNAGAGAGM